MRPFNAIVVYDCTVTTKRQKNPKQLRELHFGIQREFDGRKRKGGGLFIGADGNGRLLDLDKKINCEII